MKCKILSNSVTLQLVEALGRVTQLTDFIALYHFVNCFDYVAAIMFAPLLVFAGLLII